jgi:aminomethyltransferase
LRETAAQIDLAPHGRIKVTGEDRARLLHAMTTNDVKSLLPGTGCYAFFLNAQGRVLADANIFCFEDHLLLDVEPESRTFVMEHLDKYIIADDVVLEDITEETVCVGIEGPAVEPPQNALRATSTGLPGYRLIGPRGALALPDLPQASPADVNTVRLEHFFPRYGDDITSGNLPQETGINDALNFNKGCYLGQEIVERVRSRGHVNRVLTGLRVEGDQPLTRGDKILFEGAEVGEITSSSYSPAMGETVALGYIRTLAAKPETEVSVSGRRGYCAPIKSSRT